MLAGSTSAVSTVATVVVVVDVVVVGAAVELAVDSALSSVDPHAAATMQIETAMRKVRRIEDRG